MSRKFDKIRNVIHLASQNLEKIFNNVVNNFFILYYIKKQQDATLAVFDLCLTVHHQCR